MIRTFAARPQHREAVQWDGSEAALADIRQLAGDNAQRADDGATVVITAPGRPPRVLTYGMWLSKTEGGSLVTSSDESFRALFEEIR